MAAIKKIEARTLQFIDAHEILKQAHKMVTHEELAKIIGVESKTTITEILKKRQNIQPDQWRLFREYFKISTEYSVQNEVNRAFIVNDDGRKPFYIELKTASGKILKVIPEGENEIALLNAFLEERDRIISEKELRKIESDARAERAEKEKDRLYGIIENYLRDIHSNSKEIVDDISALTDEIQAEHRAMMDSIDVAAKQPIGTTSAAADSVELASQQERVGKGKRTPKAGKPG